MDKSTRNAIDRATQKARRLLEDEFAAQLAGTFDILPSGHVGEAGGGHLTPRQAYQRDVIVAAIERKRASGLAAAPAVADYLRDAAFTTLNRFVALKLLEARKLLQECITSGEQSAGYAEFHGMAPGIELLPDGAGYRLYLESLFDELSTEIKVLFDRRDPASILWPRRQAFDGLLEILNGADLKAVWTDDETLGWVYQYFNGAEERKKMRDESPAPRNSRELAVRNQFFTPRYVVQFLTDNTLGRSWVEMHGEKTQLLETCEYLVRPIDEPFGTRPRKDPRDLRILDPACGSGHFLLYSFDLLLAIYEEAWAVGDAGPASSLTGRKLRADYPELAQLQEAAPALIVEHNLYGVDIDARCAQIAALALWLRSQRAYQALGLRADARPRIQRTHIVIAEPMPDDRELAAAFAGELEKPFQQALFSRMIEEMRLAGELGTLLQIEVSLADDIRRARRQYLAEQERPSLFPDLRPRIEQGKLDLSGVTDETVFQDTEGTILTALGRFAESAGGADARRRLFAGDATHGVALIDLLRTRFDVVLMNPPFGQPIPGSKDVLKRQYADSWTDLFNAFLTRAQQLSTSTGASIGAIVPDRLLVSKKSSAVRKRLLGALGLNTLVYVGPEVMDGAAVTAILLTASSNQRLGQVLTKTLSAAGQNRPQELRQWARSPGPPVDFAGIAFVPGSPFVLSENSAAIDLWQRSARLHPDLAVVATGGKTFDDFRFLRAWWEVPDTSLAVKWFPVDTGGDYKPGLSLPKLVQNWHDEGHEVRAKALSERGTDAQVIQSSKFWFTKGIAYPYTSSIGFSPRLIFADSILSSDAVAIVPNEPGDLLWLLGVLLSSHTDASLATFGAGRKTENGSVKSLPIERPPEASALARAVSQLIAVGHELEALDETSRAFCKPLQTSPQDMRQKVEDVTRDIDMRSAAAYGIEADAGATPVLLRRASSWLAEAPVSPSRTLSHVFGMVFRRWEIANQPCSQSSAERLARLDLRPPVLARPEASSAIVVAVDDSGHPSDIVRLVQAQVEEALLRGGLGSSDSPWWINLDGGELRTLIAHDFFPAHLRQYSAGGRAAPIYWQLGTLTGRYSVWLYAHRVTPDTLFLLQSEVVGPKLSHEERQLTTLRQDAGASPRPPDRKAIAAQEGFVEDLRSMLAEIKRVAPLWNPNLDDGIVLVSAPLWRLVSHKAWQKELKSRWDDLVAGKYDWANLALHLWPERVVPKCATDRSLAIAHGLEEIFWVEGTDGKWTKRAHPTRSIEDLVAGRASPAVKAALADLLAAPALAGGRGRGT